MAAAPDEPWHPVGRPGVGEGRRGADCRDRPEPVVDGLRDLEAERVAEEAEVARQDLREDDGDDPDGETDDHDRRPRRPAAEHGADDQRDEQEPARLEREVGRRAEGLRHLVDVEERDGERDATPASAATRTTTRAISASRTIAARICVLPSTARPMAIPSTTATGRATPSAIVGRETPTIVASCGRAMRPDGDRGDERGRRQLAWADQSLRCQPSRSRRSRSRDARASPSPAPARWPRRGRCARGRAPRVRLAVASSAGRRSASAARARPRHTSGTTTTVPRASASRANDWLSAKASSAHGPIGASVLLRSAPASRWTPAATRIVWGRMNPEIASPPPRLVIVASAPSSPS